MKYKLPNKEANLYPPALSLLASISDEALENNSKYYHPADTFLLAFNDAVESLSRLAEKTLDEMNLQNNGGGETSESTAQERMDGFRSDVFNMMFYCGNFIEACQTTIKSVLHYDEKKSKKAASTFNSRVESYRSHVSKIINEIKHKHRRIRVFSAKWSAGVIIGYYVEGVVEKNIIGPDPLVHKRHNMAATGFSLNRELQYQLVNIYFASACLESVLRNNSVGKGMGASNDIVRGNASINEKLNVWLEKISSLPALYLPNEFSSEFYSVVKKDRGYVLSESKEKEAQNNKPHAMNINLSARIGLFNCGLEIPYFIDPKLLSHIMKHI